MLTDLAFSSKCLPIQSFMQIILLHLFDNLRIEVFFILLHLMVGKIEA